MCTWFYNNCSLSYGTIPSDGTQEDFVPTNCPVNRLGNRWATIRNRYQELLKAEQAATGSAVSAV